MWLREIDGMYGIQVSGLGKGRGFHIERPFLIINNWSTVAITVFRKGVEVQYL